MLEGEGGRGKRGEKGEWKAGGQVDGLGLWEGEEMEGGKGTRKRLREHGFRKGWCPRERWEKRERGERKGKGKERKGKGKRKMNKKRKGRR